MYDTLPNAPEGQVKLHSKKCCGSPFSLLAFSGVWALTLCVLVPALTISAIVTWLMVSLSHRLLLITKALWSTSIVGYGCHLFVIAPCRSKLLMIKFLFSRRYKNILLFVLSVFVVGLFPWPPNGPSNYMQCEMARWWNRHPLPLKGSLAMPVSGSIICVYQLFGALLLTKFAEFSDLHLR